MASSADLGGRRVLVTGGTGGIGRATVRRLVDAGASVVAVARRAGPLEALARETGADTVRADVSDRAAVDGLRDRVLEDGVPWAVVNAAGGFDLAPVAGTDPEMFDRMIDGNLRAPFLVMRAFLPAMLEAGAGVVVTLGSVAGRVAFPGNGAYSAAKFGVRGLHEVLQQELVGTGVRCTLVEPAATDTAIWDPLDPDGRDDLPGRDAMLSAEAVADAILYAITRPRDMSVPTVAVQRS
jgi:NADP-dependent 3-hydroxy acid dehydrogenase YdfG